MDEQLRAVQPVHPQHQHGILTEGDGVYVNTTTQSREHALDDTRGIPHGLLTCNIFDVWPERKRVHFCRCKQDTRQLRYVIGTHMM